MIGPSNMYVIAPWRWVRSFARASARASIPSSGMLLSFPDLALERLRETGNHAADRLGVKLVMPRQEAHDPRYIPDRKLTRAVRAESA